MNGGDVFDSRDSAIKLFGTTISAPESQVPVTAAVKSDVGFQIPDKPQPLDDYSEISKVQAKDAHLEDCGNQAKSSVTEDENDEKLLKKPDKIIPCPRCDSMDTKFCYFNNYNVNQPRHFCKQCQRYWTAGGTMRNVPVGAGRRKNKQFPPQFGQILVSAPSTLQEAATEVPVSTDLRPPSSGESRNAFGNLTTGRIAEREKIGESSSCVSSVNSSQWYPVPQSTQPNYTQCYPVPPWVVPSEMSGAPSVGNPNPIRWCTTSQLLAVPGFSTQSIPLQFVPTSYLGCLPVWAGGPAQKPTAGPDDGRSPSSSTSNAFSGNNTPTLGKHPRGEDSFGEGTQEKCVLVPKILRLDRSEEASKSSALGALGFKPNHNEMKFKCNMFRPFKSTTDCKDLASDKSEVLEANPAALSRSHTFQEST